MAITIALDAMGGDHGPLVVVPAALEMLAERPELELLLVGREDAVASALKVHRAEHHPRLSVIAASEVVGMDEPPALAVRGKKDSSMRVAINLVKEGRAAACVSAGNTGALMAISHFVLKMLPGIERPAIVTAFPNLHGEVHILDLGANVDCTPHQLFQFAQMGSILVQAVRHIDRPTVGLLNVGTEDIKGNQIVKEAGQLLRSSPLNYIGFVEGDAIYTGKVDVIVCNGFVGNVALKTSEGLAQMMGKRMREAFGRNLWTRLAAVAALPALSAFKRQVDHRRYNGASLVGLAGTVIKSRGSADALAFAFAIREAVAEVRHGVRDHIRRDLAPATQAGA